MLNTSDRSKEFCRHIVLVAAASSTVSEQNEMLSDSFF